MFCYQISCDAVPITNTTQYSFFNDNRNESDERATALCEQEIMEWLFEGPLASNIKQILCEELGLPLDCLHFLGVKSPFIEHTYDRPGDIDLILCPKDDPRYTVAMECKRVKVRFDDSRKAVINKAGALMKGIDQVNALHDHGFHKCFLFIVVVTDGHNLTEQGQLFRYADAETMRDVYYFPGFHKLHNDIGVILCLLTQPTGKSINKSVSVAVREHKIATGQYILSHTREKMLTLLKQTSIKF